MTSTKQYGYKQGLSTIDAVYKIEQYIQEWAKNTQILLMDLAEAFDTVNRTQLWTALYKKGLPLEISPEFGEDAKTHNYVSSTEGNMENHAETMSEFPKDPQSARMFIIYLDDMMEDYEALNHRPRLPARHTIHRDPNTGNRELLAYIAKKKKNTPHDIAQYMKNG